MVAQSKYDPSAFTERLLSLIDEETKVAMRIGNYTLPEATVIVCQMAVGCAMGLVARAMGKLRPRSEDVMKCANALIDIVATWPEQK